MKAGLGYKKQQNNRKRFDKKIVSKRRTLFTEQVLMKRRNYNLDDRLRKSSILKRNNNKSKMFSREHALCVIKFDISVENVQILNLLVLRETKSDVVNQKSTKFESKQTWKPKMSKAESQQSWKPLTPRFRTTQNWKTTVDVTILNQFWKAKVIVQNQNIQNEIFCQRNVSKGQISVVKQHKLSNDEKTNKENVFKKNGRNYLVLPGKIHIQLPESKQAWVA
ncbi:hypothetical protein Hanom_Chr05g00407851 [Helianthus anomalus]